MMRFIKTILVILLTAVFIVPLLIELMVFHIRRLLGKNDYNDYIFAAFVVCVDYVLDWEFKK